jgi:hypothetical protein
MLLTLDDLNKKIDAMYFDIGIQYGIIFLHRKLRKIFMVPYGLVKPRIGCIAISSKKVRGEVART